MNKLTKEQASFILDKFKYNCMGFNVSNHEETELGIKMIKAATISLEITLNQCTEKETLKPCPLCFSTEIWEDDDRGAYGYLIRCMCGIMLYGIEDKDLAIETWNNRTCSTPP